MRSAVCSMDLRKGGNRGDHSISVPIVGSKAGLDVAALPLARHGDCDRVTRYCEACWRVRCPPRGVTCWHVWRWHVWRWHVALAAMTVAPPLTFLLVPNAGGSPAAAVSATVASRAISASEWQRLLPGVVALWLLGVLAFSIRLFGGWRFTARLRATAHPAPAAWQQTLERIAARLGASHPVRLLVSSLVDVPTVIGWLRPVILLPVGRLTGLPAEHITALLAHELAHIRRQDYLASILQSIAEALLFYHPAVWWISEQIRAERELCCDDLAVAASGDVLTYARALAELESQQPSRLKSVLAANGGSLVNRIRRLIEPAQVSANNLPGPLAAWAMTLLWLAGVGVATVHAARIPAQGAMNLDPVPVSAKSGAVPALPANPVAALASHARDTLLYDPLLSAQLAQPMTQPRVRGGAERAVAVVVSKVRRASVPVSLTCLGTVTPSNTVTVKTRVDGQIMSANFQEGDLVKQDQVLFTIDPRPYQVMLNQAEGQFSRDQAQLASAQTDLSRYRALTAQNATPHQQLNTQAALVDQLEGALKADQAAVEMQNCSWVTPGLQRRLPDGLASGWSTRATSCTRRIRLLF